MSPGNQGEHARTSCRAISGRPVVPLPYHAAPAAATGSCPPSTRYAARLSSSASSTTSPVPSVYSRTAPRSFEHVFEIGGTVTNRQPPSCSVSCDLQLAGSGRPS